MLKLNVPTVNTQEFKADITGLLPKDAKFYVAFNFKPGGAVNPLYTAGLERIRHADLVTERVLGRIENDESYADAALKAQTERGRQWFGMLYDACIVSWETNILDDDKPIMATRENFVELASAVFPQSLSQAMASLNAAILQAGRDAEKVDEDTVKN